MPWELTGNPNTNPTVDFVGTTDNQPLVIGTNGTERVVVDPGGKVGIGTGATSLTAALQIAAVVQGLKVGLNGNMANANVEVLGDLEVVGQDGTSVSSVGASAWNFYNAGNNPSFSGTLLRYYGQQTAGTVNGLPAANQGNIVFQNTSNGAIVSNGETNIHVAPKGTVSTTFNWNGNVGIGTPAPNSKLTVVGIIESTVAGFKFPDGSIQATAQTRGPQGPQGAQGPQGPQGPPGVSPPPQVVLSRNTGGGGFIALLGPGGRQTHQLTGMVGAPDNGTMGVTDAAGAAAGVFKAGMYVDPTNGEGTIVASVKNFRVPNPNQANTDIVYACIEGPEAAVYVRGTAQLVGGQATVSLPDHFTSVTGTGSMTAQVTPLSTASLGLAVTEKRPNAIVVAELHNGTGSYDFDWEVKATRKGHENYRVVRPSSEMALPQPPQ